MKIYLHDLIWVGDALLNVLHEDAPQPLQVVHSEQFEQTLFVPDGQGGVKHPPPLLLPQLGVVGERLVLQPLQWEASSLSQGEAKLWNKQRNHSKEAAWV